MSNPTLTLIVAADQKNAIGRDNQMPWHLPNDFKYFKKNTLEHSIIMGRKTFESIGKALSSRRNIVITRQSSFNADNIELAKSIEEAINFCQDEKEVFIIGGAEIFNQTLPLASKILLTRVHTTIAEADTFFPELPANQWQLISSENHIKDEKHLYDYTFEVYQKLKA